MRSLLFTFVLAAAVPVATLDVMAWPGMTPEAFACLMQKELGFKDAAWKCGMKPVKNRGDICTDPTAFRAGPQLDEKTAKKVHPYVRKVRLAWEAGKLQSVELELTGMIERDEIRRVFKLGERFVRPRPNVHDMVMYPCTDDAMCLKLQSFEATEARCMSQAPSTEE